MNQTQIPHEVESRIKIEAQEFCHQIYVRLLEEQGFPNGYKFTHLVEAYEGAAISGYLRSQQLINDHKEVDEDKKRLVRELDVIINGEEGAARQASLVDMVAQIRDIWRSEPDWEKDYEPVEDDIYDAVIQAADAEFKRSHVFYKMRRKIAELQVQRPGPDWIKAVDRLPEIDQEIFFEFAFPRDKVVRLSGKFVQAKNGIGQTEESFLAYNGGMYTVSSFGKYIRWLDESPAVSPTFRAETPFFAPGPVQENPLSKEMQQIGMEELWKWFRTRNGDDIVMYKGPFSEVMMIIWAAIEAEVKAQRSGAVGDKGSLCRFPPPLDTMADFFCWNEYGGGERCEKMCESCSGKPVTADKEKERAIAFDRWKAETGYQPIIVDGDVVYIHELTFKSMTFSEAYDLYLRDTQTHKNKDNA